MLTEDAELTISEHSSLSGESVDETAGDTLDIGILRDEIGDEERRMDLEAQERWYDREMARLAAESQEEDVDDADKGTEEHQFDAMAQEDVSLPALELKIARLQLLIGCKFPHGFGATD